MTSPTGSPHLDDGALARILDGQPLDDDDSEAIVGHLAGCSDCSARYRLVEGRSRSFHQLLESARDGEPWPPAGLWDRARETAGERSGPASWTRSPLLRAAAIAAVLFAGALTAEPVRQWLGEAARQAVAALGLAGPAPAPAPVPEPHADDGVEVTLTPIGDRLVLRFDAAEPDALVRVTFRDGPDAAGQAVGETAADLVALPDGFRVRNAGARGSLYRVTAPAGMPVELRVGGVVTTVLVGDAGQQREVALTVGG